jgi:2-polyprenyl-3-methyl-5-hydroxy-6-metoxy-1,4-benzoquinol methylase
MDRFTAGWFENLLLQVWIPAVSRLANRLSQGIDVADIGCGRGRALVKMAKAFPASRFVGYDVYSPNITRAQQIARASGVSECVRFAELDAAKGLPQPFDLITTFDVIHDAADPLGILKSIRTALRKGGTYLCLDINCSHKLEENAGPLGAFFHGCSTLYCMTTSLARGGEGLGTLGLHPPKLQELAAEAGFSLVRKLPLDNPFNNLYQLE